MLKVYLAVRLRGELIALGKVGKGNGSDDGSADRCAGKTLCMLAKAWRWGIRGARELEWPLLIVGIFRGLDVYLLVFGCLSLWLCLSGAYKVFNEARCKLQVARPF